MSKPDGAGLADPPQVMRDWSRTSAAKPLVSEHGMTRVSYSTVSNNIASRGLIPQPAARHTSDPGHDVRQVVMHLEEALKAMQPGIVARLKPHLDALALIIEQTLGDTEADARGAELGPARHRGVILKKERV